MKTSLLKLVSLGMLVAPYAQAEVVTTQPASVSTTKQSSIHELLPNAFGSVDLRHYFKHEKPSDNKKLTSDPYLQPRLNLGTTFFKTETTGLKSQFIFGVNNKYGSDQNSGLITDKGTRLENEFTVYKNDYVSFVPFLYLEFPKFTDEKAGPTKGEIGIDIPLEYPFHTAAGTLTLQAEVIGSTYFGSKPDPEDQVEVRHTDDRTATTTSLTLTDEQKKTTKLVADKDGNYKADPVGRSLYHWFSFGAKYEPSVVKGLETQVLAIYETTYTPVMEVADGSATARTRTSSGTFNTVYSKTFEPSYLFHVKYTLTDTYSVTNEFTLKDRAEGQRKYTNMVSLVAKLF